MPGLRPKNCSTAAGLRAFVELHIVRRAIGRGDGHRQRLSGGAEADGFAASGADTSAMASAIEARARMSLPLLFGDASIVAEALAPAPWESR